MVNWSESESQSERCSPVELWHAGGSWRQTVPCPSCRRKAIYEREAAWPKPPPRPLTAARA